MGFVYHGPLLSHLLGALCKLSGQKALPFCVWVAESRTNLESQETEKMMSHSRFASRIFWSNQANACIESEQFETPRKFKIKLENDSLQQRISLSGPLLVLSRVITPFIGVNNSLLPICIGVITPFITT